MTLTEFLAARLDEVKATAAAATHGGNGRWVLQGHPSESAMIWDSNGSAVVYNEGSPSEAEAAHIVLHDPAHVLREVEAGRKLLAASQKAVREADFPDWHGGYASGLEDAVKYRAEVYDSHPDWDEAWRP